MRIKLFWVMFVFSAVVVMRQPLFGLIAYLGLNIIRPDMIRIPKVAHFYFMVVTVIGLVLNIRKVDLRAIFNREVLLMVWVYIGILISMHYSPFVIELAGRYAQEFLKLIIVCILIFLLCNNPKKIFLVQDLLLIGFMLLGLWGIEQSFRGNERLEGLGGSAVGDSNGVAAMFVLFLPLALNKLFHPQNSKSLWFGITSSAILLLLIILTKSRGGFLGMVICVAYYIFRSNQKKKIIVSICAFLLFASFFVSNDYTERMKTIFGDEEAGGFDSSASSRLVFWKAGLMVFRDNLLFGTGFMAYPLAKLQYAEEFPHLEPDRLMELFRTNDPYVTHNTYIQMLSEVGIFGALPYFSLIGLVFISNMKVRSRATKNTDNTKLLNLLTAIEVGIAGHCCCIMFINSINMIYLPIQIAFCSLIRKFLIDNNLNSNGSY